MAGIKIEFINTSSNHRFNMCHLNINVGVVGSISLSWNNDCHFNGFLALPSSSIYVGINRSNNFLLLHQ
ncbi:hypothetical protein L6452_27206 [Arctium lappa]|uniref:Uncharacterized protein n=1 Tax=Arctium lappa TaxID=4217 RepID=A0ACB8ZV16_ARCLA|nr:hypothetical protein L6452_27206 [Arctium lappa]